MQIKELKNRTRFNNEKIGKSYQKFSILIEELKEQTLNDTVLTVINEQIDLLNKTHDEKLLKKLVRIVQQKVLKLIEKEHKIVAKNYYRNLWMVLGMSVFGISFGAAFGAALGNMGLIGIGLPFGMLIGIAVGTKKDKEAAKNGLQLQYDINAK